MKYFISLLLTFGFINMGLVQCKYAENESYLIPTGFRGRVNIIFNQNNGAPPRYENGRRIYLIPSNGILLTQFPGGYGFVNHEYYYVDSGGIRQSLPIFRYEYAKDGTTKWIVKDPYQTGIFLDGTTGAYGNGNNKYEAFEVSDYIGLDSIESFQNFSKRVEEVLHTKFGAGTLSNEAMDSIEKKLDHGKN
jgi:hypothetical protein